MTCKDRLIKAFSQVLGECFFCSDHVKPIKDYFMSVESIMIYTFETKRSLTDGLHLLPGTH